MEKILYIPIDTTIDSPYECEKLIKRGDILALQIKIFNNGALVDLTGQTVDLILKKSDNTFIQKNILDISNGMITAVLTVQATNTSGLVSGEVQITDSNSQTSSNTFTFNVDSSVASETLDLSENDIQTINDLKALIINGNIIDINNRVTQNTAQLLEKANDTDSNRTTSDKTVTGSINELNNNKANKSEVNSLATNKADNTVVQALDVKVNALASGAPKVVSLVADMTDTTKNYVYTGAESGYTAGNWYYYNGSAWVSGGTWQGKVLADDGVLTNNVKSGAIISEKTDFVTQSANLFNKNTITNNYYINNSGEITPSTSLGFSDYIPVKPGDLITVTIGLSSPGESYDQNKNRVGTPYAPVSGEVMPFTFTVPEGVYNVRLNMFMDNVGKDINSFMMVKGNYLPSSYIPYEKYIPYLKVKNNNIQNGAVTNEKIADEAVSLEKMKHYNVENMFDKTTITVNKYVSNTGILTDSATLSLSDFIQVVAGQTYTVPRGYTSQGGYYDSDNNWKSAINGSSIEEEIWSFTVPNGAAYVRLNMVDDVIDSWMMVEGATYPSYYSPYGITIPWLNVKDDSVSYNKLNDDLKTKVDSLSSKWAGKTIVCFGDSITWYDGNAYNANTNEAGVIAKGYESYMREELEATVINQGVSGNTILQIAERIQAYNFTGVDAVTIMAGTNNFRDSTPIGVIAEVGSQFDTTTFIGAYQSAIEYILNNYPEVKLYLFTPIKGWDTKGRMPNTYADAVISLGEFYGLSVCDLYGNSGINDLTKSVYIVDSSAVTFQYHPSTKGYKRIADIIMPFLENH